VTSSQQRPAISSLPRGHELAPATFRLTDETIASYLGACGDVGVYASSAPPLAAIALGLAALQEQLALPDGTLHTGQEVEHLAPIPANSVVSLTGRIAQRSERQGFVISVLEFEVLHEDAIALRARATIMAPAA
jgi:hypothetical protein